MNPFKESVVMDPEKGPLQKLLLLDEYSDMEDIVMVEGSFVELDKTGDAVQQVVMGISPDHLLMGRRQVISWKEDPLITSELDADLDLYGLELKWVTPLRYIDISAHSDEEYVLKVSSKHARCRYFELCTVPQRDSNWYKWLDRINYLKDDPYGYITNMRLRKNSASSLSSEIGLSSDDSDESLKTGGLELDLLPDTDGNKGEGEAKDAEKASDRKPLLTSKTKKRKTIFSRIWKRCKSKESVSRSKTKI